MPSRCVTLAGIFAICMLFANAVFAGCEPPIDENQPAAPRVAIERAGPAPRGVVDIAVAGNVIWLATRGSGVFGVVDGSLRHHFDVARGLPSAAVSQIQPTERGLLVATDRGLVLVDVDKARYRCIGPRGKTFLRGPIASDIVRNMPGDGGPLAQLRSVDGMGLTGRVGPDELRPATEDELPAGVTMAAAMDMRRRCLDIAGMQARTGHDAIWLVRQCEVPRPTLILRQRTPRGVIGIAAVARDPVGLAPVLAVVTQDGNQRSSRRYALMTVTAQKRLVPYCRGAVAPFREELTAMATDHDRKRLVIALRGRGLQSVRCPARQGNDFADLPALRDATALVIDAGRVIVGTERGAFMLEDSVRLTPLLQTPEGDIPLDAMVADAKTDPVSATDTVLLTSPNRGIAELTRTGSTWSTSRPWWRPEGLGAGVAGAAVYGGPGAIYLVVHPQGLLRAQGSTVSWLALPPAAAGSAPAPQWLNNPESSPRPLFVQLAPDGAGGAWLGMDAMPIGGKGRLWHLKADGSSSLLTVGDARAQPLGRVLPMPDGTIRAATALGVMAVNEATGMHLVSSNGVQALFRSPGGPGFAAVGETVEWSADDGFEPVLFGMPADTGAQPAPIAHPVDVVIDKLGRWIILLSNGKLVLLDDSRHLVASLGVGNGVPGSARRLLLLPSTNEVLIGTRDEGVFVLKW